MLDVLLERPPTLRGRVAICARVAPDGQAQLRSPGNKPNAWHAHDLEGLVHGLRVGFTLRREVTQ